MKKICFLLCLLLTLATLVACGEKKDPVKQTTEAAKEGLTLKNELDEDIKGDITLGVGESKMLKVFNSKTKTQTSNVLWTSSDPNVVEVTFEGMLIGKSNGTAVITATSIVDDKNIVSCNVNVTSKLVGVMLDREEITLSIGDTYSFVVTYLPESFTGAELKWSSGDESIVSIVNGELKALSPGKTTIWVESVDSDEISDTCAVNVVKPVTAIKLSKDTVTISKGESIELSINSMEPADASDPIIEWQSSNPNIVSIGETSDEKGITNGKVMVTAKGGGTAKITAKTGNGVSAVCEITVIVPVTGVTIEEGTAITLLPGTSQQLNCSVAPQDALNQEVIWQVVETPGAQGPVVTVDENGLVTAVRAGSATVRVTTVEGYFTAACTVTVSNTVTSLSFEQIEDNLLIGQTMTLVPVQTPVDADPPILTWSTSAPDIAGVDANGVVNAIAAGKAVITVTTENNVSATFTLTVIDPATISVPITGILASNKEVELGDVFKLSVTVAPSNATEKYYIESLNPDKVVVNEDGTLRAIGTGFVTVNIYTENRSVEKLCYIVVNNLSAAKRAELQNQYNAKWANIETEHAKKVDEINKKYATDIDFWIAAIEKLSLKDEANYTAQKTALEEQIAAAADGDKAALQSKLTALNAEWEDYLVAKQTLSYYENARDEELDAEETNYQQKLTDLKDEFFMLQIG